MQLTFARKATKLFLLPVACCLLAPVWVPPCLAADDYVVIVNKANPADSISAADLRAMFLGQKTSWADGAKVVTVTPSPEGAEYGSMIKKATGMSSGDFKRYFIQVSFIGKIVPLPKAFASSTDATRFVSNSPGAISCVPATIAGTGVKILKVE